ncbi:MAG TPA: hypothetical protein PKZ29_00370 [Candidatus Woesebacteria bacterium]|nr:hypothetical protein [Candidatus Woesebacteria bacterium]HOG37357.1 hypothetical protein [Candidatus Woesebacteria bacterium]
MSKTAEGLNPTAYGLPANELPHRSDLTAMPATDTGARQIGLVFENGQPTTEMRDYAIVSTRKDGRPKYNESEGMSRAEIIWQRFQIEKDKMEKNDDRRHLFLLRKGYRILGLGRYQWVDGNINSDWLIATKPKSSGMMPIYSFNERGSGIFCVVSTNKYGDKKAVNLGRDIGFLDYNQRIDLNKLKGSDELDKILTSKSTKG